MRRSLATGFVYTNHDLPEDVIDEAYDKLAEFFSMDQAIKEKFIAPGSHGQTGYTGLLVETAASAEVPDWKEMLNWSDEPPAGHPLRRKYPHRYMDQVLPEAAVPGITDVLMLFHQRIYDLQRRFLRDHRGGPRRPRGPLRDDAARTAPRSRRAIRYPPMPEAPPRRAHVWAGEHADINLITALPRATAPGLQVKTDDGWVDAVAPEGGVIINTGMMLEVLSNGVIPPGIHRVVADPTYAGRALQRRAVLPPHPVDDPLAAAVVLHPGDTRSATAPSRRATSSTRSSTRSTSSKTPGGWRTDVVQIVRVR